MKSKFLSREGFLVLLSLAMSYSGFAQQGPKTSFNAFGDITYGKTFGDPANANAYNLFQAFGDSGIPNNVNEGFGIVGADFVLTSTITEDLTFQSEINLQVDRGGSSDVGLDLERAYLDYNVNEKFGIQAGLFFTPIGFSNRNLYARAWLMNSVQIRDIAEEATELVPTHSAGANIYGKFIKDNGLGLSYVVSVANGRDNVPAQFILARNFQDTYTYTALLELSIPKANDFRIGVSVFTGDINTIKVDNLGDVVVAGDPGVEAVELTEFGFNPYIYYNSKPFNFFGEFHSVTMTDQLGTLSEDKHTLTSITAELAVNLSVNDKRLAPYVRYDKTSFNAETHPYYGLRGSNDAMTKVFIPKFNAVMLGIAYDVTAFNRLKIEYINHLGGARDQHGLTIQTAFGF